jgi:hypothetical protein
MAFHSLRLRLVLQKIRGNGGDLWLGSMRLVFHHVFVAERVQAIYGVELVISLRLDL